MTDKSRQFILSITIVVLLWLAAMPQYTALANRAEKLKVENILILVERAQRMQFDYSGEYVSDIDRISGQVPGLAEALADKRVAAWDYSISISEGNVCSVSAVRRTPFSFSSQKPILVKIIKK